VHQAAEGETGVVAVHLLPGGHAILFAFNWRCGRGDREGGGLIVEVQGVLFDRGGR